MALKIYIFKTGQSAYKIGVSSNVESRRNQVQTGCPTKVEIFKAYEVRPGFIREGNGKPRGHARVIVALVENAGREFGDSTHLMRDCNLMK